MQHPDQKVRLTVTVVLVVCALLTTFGTPLIVKRILPEIIDNQLAKFEKMSSSDNPEEVKKAPLIEDTPYLVSFFYPFWLALSMFGGVVILVIAKSFYEGKKWSRGVALLATSIPSMGGAYMLIPWINFVGFGKGFPFPIAVALFGLVPYFTILLAEKAEAMTKLANSMVFLALGVTGAHSFTIGHASLRFQWMHPARPLWPEGMWVLWISTQFMWLGTICLVLAIYFFGAKKRTGWYLALIGGLVVTIANTWAEIVRGTGSDYLLGAIFGLIVIVLMLVPFFRDHIFDTPAASTA